MKVTGLDDAKMSLQMLVTKTNPFMAAIAGAAIMVRSIKDAAPVKTGLLRDSVIMKRMGDNSSYLVTVRAGRKHSAGAYYAKWVEFGHRARSSKVNHKRGKRYMKTVSVGNVPAHPFFNPTVSANARAAQDAMIAEFEKQLQEVVNGNRS